MRAVSSLATTEEPVVAGGCRVRAHAFLSGLTLAPQPFSYHYTGTLSGCAYTGKGAPRSTETHEFSFTCFSLFGRLRKPSVQ